MTTLDTALVDAAVAAQARACEALDTLSAAHDTEGCARVADHRGKPWGVERDRAAYTYALSDDGAEHLRLATPVDTDPRHDRVRYDPIDHGEVTVVREWNPDSGDTLHVFTSALRNDAEATTRVDTYHAKWGLEEDCSSLGT